MDSVIDLNSLPADQRANFGTITQAAAMFKGTGGTAFGFMLPFLQALSLEYC